MLRPFNKLTCESENQGIKNLEAKITGLREKVQLREETPSCTYISQTVNNTRATFFILPKGNSMKIFADISYTRLVYEFDQIIIFHWSGTRETKSTTPTRNTPV